MPLILIEDIFPDVKLGVWKMDESVEDLFILNPLLVLQKERVLILAALNNADVRYLRCIS